MQSGLKKIAFVHDTFPFGGAERVTIDIANYLSSCGLEIYIFTGKFDKDKYPKNTPQNFKVIELGEPTITKSKKDTLELIKYTNELDIQIVTCVVKEMEYINLLLENTACKYVFAHHGTPFWEAHNKIDMASKRRNNSVGTFLEWLFISYPKYHIFKSHKRRFYKLYYDTYIKADRYTVLCEDYKRELVKSLNLSSNNNIRAIPNLEHEVENINLSKKKQILFVGRLSHSDKRVDRLVDIWEKAYRELPDWELIIVGDGEERKNLEERSRNAKLERISFKGFTSNVKPYYDSASILCLTSTFEGWGLCLTEAQANGVVPIAFDCSAGVRSIISPSGVNGILITPFNITKFASELIALAKDHDRLEKMKYNVIEKSKEYSITVVGKKWLNLFEELV